MSPTSAFITTWGFFVFHNNLLANLMMAPPFWVVITGDYGELFAAGLRQDSDEHLDGHVHVTFVLAALSCALGLFISFSGFTARRAFSATAFTVTGVVNKFLKVVINVLIWDKHASPSVLLF